MVIPSVNIPELARSNERRFRVGKVPVWDFEAGDFKQSSEGNIAVGSKETLKQIIRVSLIVERGAHPIYTWDFGSDINSFIGQHPDYVEARLPKAVREALNDARIESVRVQFIRQTDANVFYTVTVVDTSGNFLTKEELQKAGAA